MEDYGVGIQLNAEKVSILGLMSLERKSAKVVFEKEGAIHVGTEDGQF